MKLGYKDKNTKYVCTRRETKMHVRTAKRGHLKAKQRGFRRN